jgi:hypothetical protein
MSLKSAMKRASFQTFKTRVKRCTQLTILHPLLTYSLVALWLTWPVVLHPFDQIIGGIPDSYQYSWYLGWFWHAVTHGQSPLYSSEMNWPQGFGFMYNTSIIALSVLFGWLVPLTSPVFVYNLVFFINIVLIGWLGNILLRNLGVTPSLSRFGGVMFCLMPYLTTQNIGHISITFIPPLFGILILIVRSIKVHRQNQFWYGISIGILFAIEFYTSIEVTMTFLLAITIFLGVLAVQKAGRQLLLSWLSRLPKHFWFALVITTSILTLPGIVDFFLSGGLAVAKTKFHPGSDNWYVADLLSPFYPTRLFAVQSDVTNTITSHFTGNLEENGSYIGLVMFAIVIFFRNTWRDVLSRSLLYSGLTLFVLSLGVALHVNGYTLPVPLPWSIFAHIPFLNCALPVRLALYVDACLILWTTLSLQKYLQRPHNAPRRRLWRVRVFSLLAILMWLPVFPYPHAAAHTVPSEMVNKIGSKPVFWITPNFGYEMQSLASTGYQINAYNLYGFAPHRSLGSVARTPLAVHFFPLNESVQYWSNQLDVIENAIRPSYILLAPFNQRGVSMPATLWIALKQRLGKPELQSNGYVLWHIK